MTEKQFQKEVIDLAMRVRWLVYHTHDSRRSQPGFPDLVMVRGTRVIFAELKSEKGKVKPEQQVWLEVLAVAGMETYLWRPSDWDTIIACLW